MSSPDYIQHKLEKHGSDRAHTIVYVSRALREDLNVEAQGHMFNVYYDGEGQVWALDGTTGEIQQWPPDYDNDEALVVGWGISVPDDWFDDDESQASRSAEDSSGEESLDDAFDDRPDNGMPAGTVGARHGDGSGPRSHPRA